MIEKLAKQMYENVSNDPETGTNVFLARDRNVQWEAVSPHVREFYFELADLALKSIDMNDFDLKKLVDELGAPNE